MRYVKTYYESSWRFFRSVSAVFMLIYLVHGDPLGVFILFAALWGGAAKTLSVWIDQKESA